MSMSAERQVAITIDAALRATEAATVVPAADTAITARLCAHVVLLATQTDQRRAAAERAARHFGTLLPASELHARQISADGLHGAACAARTAARAHRQLLAQGWVQVEHGSAAPTPGVPVSGAVVSEMARLCDAANRWLLGAEACHALQQADRHVQPQKGVRRSDEAQVAHRATRVLDALDPHIGRLPSDVVADWIHRDWPAHPRTPVPHPWRAEPDAVVDAVDAWARQALNVGQVAGSVVDQRLAAALLALAGAV